MALVRVRIKTGNKVRVKNMGRALAEASDNVEILDGEPITKADGSPLPETTASGRIPKPPTSVDQEAAKKATGKSADQGEDSDTK